MRDKEEEEMYSLLNELDIEKIILENTLSQIDLSGYDKDLLEQYQEELDLYKRTINYIEKLYEENKELREITNGYNSLKKDSEAFGGIPLIIADEKYFNEGIFKESYINKDKIRELFKGIYTIEESKYAKMKTIDSDKAFKFVKDVEKLVEEE